MNIVSRFMSFDKLMGASLVKIVYYLGLIGIAIGVVFGVLGALGMMFTVNFGMGLGGLIMAPVMGIIGACFLRFACELYIVLFRIGDDIAAMRAGGASLPPAATPPPSSTPPGA